MSCKQKVLKDYGFKTDNTVFTIAEIGINHGGEIDKAKRLIDSAAKTGVDAVKFQTYITEKRVSNESPIFEILKKCELPFDVFPVLQEYAKSLGLEFFSTPFDIESVDFLESIDCKIYKIASFDVVNSELLRKIADTRKTLIISVGMANIEEIEKAYNILREKTRQISILHCISAYPTKKEDANLAAIYSLKDRFDCVVGQSDHTDDLQVPFYAVAAGAQIIEKHFKIDEKMDCVDASVSITEKQMKSLVKKIRDLECILGNGDISITEAQKACEGFRRFS